MEIKYLVIYTVYVSEPSLHLVQHDAYMYIFKLFVAFDWANLIISFRDPELPFIYSFPVTSQE